MIMGCFLFEEARHAPDPFREGPRADVRADFGVLRSSFVYVQKPHQLSELSVCNSVAYAAVRPVKHKHRDCINPQPFVRDDAAGIVIESVHLLLLFERSLRQDAVPSVKLRHCEP